MDRSTGGWPLSLRLIHWVSAALVLGALGYGVYMVQVVQNLAERFELTQTHKSIGIAMLALTVARLCLRVLVTVHHPEPAAPVLLVVAKAVHMARYVLLLAMPLSGW